MVPSWGWAGRRTPAAASRIHRPIQTARVVEERSGFASAREAPPRRGSRPRSGEPCRGSPPDGRWLVSALPRPRRRARAGTADPGRSVSEDGDRGSRVQPLRIRRRASRIGAGWPRRVRGLVVGARVATGAPRRSFSRTLTPFWNESVHALGGSKRPSEAPSRRLADGPVLAARSPCRSPAKDPPRPILDGRGQKGPPTALLVGGLQAGAPTGAVAVGAGETPRPAWPFRGGTRARIRRRARPNSDALAAGSRNGQFPIHGRSLRVCVRFTPGARADAPTPAGGGGGHWRSAPMAGSRRESEARADIGAALRWRASGPPRISWAARAGSGGPRCRTQKPKRMLWKAKFAQAPLPRGSAIAPFI